MSTKIQPQSEEWSFEVEYVAAGMAPIRTGSAARLSDFSTFQNLRDLLIPDTGLNGPRHNDPAQNHRFGVTGAPADPKIRHALTVLETLGWRGVFQKMAGPDQWHDSYPILRHCPDYPLDQSEWLMLMDAGGDGGIILAIEGDEMTAITRPAWAKKRSHCLNLLWCEFAVSQKFKDGFEDAGLTGAVFRPLKYVPSAEGYHPRLYPDKPLPACERIYWMDSDMVAPWSCCPRRLWLPGHPLHGTLLGHTNHPLVGQRGEVSFDNEGRVCRGMDYRKTDMDALRGVDFMRMAEWAQERSGVWRSYHIVSQRFRKWAHQFGCRFRMNGIKLLA